MLAPYVHHLESWIFLELWTHLTQCLCQTYLSSDELDDIDGLLTTKVVQLINVSGLLQSRHGAALAHQRLDCAFVYFLLQFKKAYVGEPGSRVAVSTSGIPSHLMIIYFLTSRICSTGVRKAERSIWHWRPDPYARSDHSKDVSCFVANDVEIL